MKSRTIKTDQDLSFAIERLRELERPYVITVGPEKVRSHAQNSRYWATLTEMLDQIQSDINTISEDTGYTPQEVRGLIAGSLLPEEAAILYAVQPEAAHSIIKTICGVPSSTRLGTKKFAQFEDIMIQTITDTAASVRAVIGAMV